MRHEGLDCAPSGRAVEAALGTLEAENPGQQSVEPEDRSGDRVQVALALTRGLRPALVAYPLDGRGQLPLISDRPGGEPLQATRRSRYLGEGQEHLARGGRVGDARAAEARDALD